MPHRSFLAHGPPGKASLQTPRLRLETASLPPSCITARNPPGGCLEQALSHHSDIKHRHRELPWSRAGAKPSVLFPHVANTSGVPFEDGLDTES